MKNVFFFLIIAGIVTSCSPGTSDPALESLQAKKDSLNAEYQRISLEIAEVEKMIAERDTSKKAPIVTLLKISNSDFNSYFISQGSVQTDQNARIVPEVPGLIKKIYVREGDRVSSGQALAKLDDAIAQQQISQTQVNLSLAKDLLAKQENLWKQKIGSEVQYLQAKNNVENLEKQMDVLKEQLSMYTLNAPFAGVVDQINLKEGEMASQMAPLMRVVNLGDMYLKADISENYIREVKQGAMVEVIIPNMDTIQSTITRVGNFIKPENRTFEITVKLPGDNPYLKPNLVAMVRINDYKADSTIVLPTSLIMRDAENRQFVFVAESAGDKMSARKVIIETGKNYEGKTEVLSGLKGEEMIVEKGARKLIDGQFIRIEENTVALARSAEDSTK